MSMHSSSPGFFKILVHNKFKKELMIPKSFVRKYWEGISNPIILKLPNNREEEVYWSQRKKNEIWLQNGWDEVVKLCHLEYEFLLTFEYKERSCFELKVYDKSASQINYHSDCGVHENNHDYIVVDDHVQREPKAKKRTNKAGIRKSMLNNVREKIEMAEALSTKLKNPSFFLVLKPSYVHGNANLVHIPSSFSRQYLNGLKGSGTIWVSDDEDSNWSINYNFSNIRKRTTIHGGWNKFCKENKLQVGDVCVFEMMTQVNPHSFKIHIIPVTQQPPPTPPHQFQESESPNRQSYNKFELRISKSKLKQFTSSVFVPIPKKFIRRNEICLGKNVTLKYGQESWIVKVVNGGSFSKGWIQFATECKLVVGDICRFKLSDRKNLVFHVSIFKEHRS
ncbi:hypothetical protein Ahy_B10g106377 [Arachis hypogaea]|uniref:TF-B3 domain-containing protein n=1 Tax=Arachis hypogaea TaxID=3818 RepID=A0A444XAR5_ARAHY|nr:hypothetical protein Ahy_B10g106377 [Arachis hypogaea]